MLVVCLHLVAVTVAVMTAQIVDGLGVLWRLTLFTEAGEEAAVTRQDVPTRLWRGCRGLSTEDPRNDVLRLQ